MLEEKLPPANRDPQEPYAELLDNLRECGVQTVSELMSLISEEYGAAMDLEKEVVGAFRVLHEAKQDLFAEVEGTPYRARAERIEAGVFFTFTGLVRVMLEKRGCELS